MKAAPRRCGGVGRADLLTLLVALAPDQKIAADAGHARGGPPAAMIDQLAQALDFYKDDKDHKDPSADHLLTDAIGALAAAQIDQAAASASASAPAQPPPPAAPLCAPLLGIRSAKAVAPAQALARPVLPPLQADDFQPSGGAPRFAPMLAAATLTRRMRATLAQLQTGCGIDLPHTLWQLARAQWPRRWQRQSRAYAPQHLLVLVDRNLHLRPYWDDQDQLVYLLGQWLGPGNLTTLTVQGDPWQVSACWSRGQARRPPPPLSAPPADTLVLLLTDMGCLGGDGAAAAVAWAAAQRLLQSRGAPVLACPPCSGQALPPNWPGRLAWHGAAGGGGARGRAGARLPSAPTPAPTDGAARPAPESPALESLLTLLSCARRIEPGLLRAMRGLDLRLAREPGLEAQFWSCQTRLDIGHDVCVWRAQDAVDYRKCFEALDPALQQAVLRTMMTAHAGRGRVIVMQEILTWACHVAATTAAPFAAAITEADAWMRRLTQGLGGRDGAAHATHASHASHANPGLLAFAQQTHAFHGGDTTLNERYGHVLGPLWALAYQAAQARGDSLPDPGALPVERLGQWCKPALAAVRLHLQQRGGSVVLQPDSVAAAKTLAVSPMGMGLDVTALTIGDLSAAQSGKQFVHPANAQMVLGACLPQQALLLHTGTLALELAQITSPFAGAERGRDRYGLYVKIAPLLGDTRLVLRMRYIEAGQFWMGSPPDERGRINKEGPRHRVTITQGFWLAETACTQELWQAVMGKNPSQFNEKNRGGPRHPVEKVSWHDAQGFLDKLQRALRASTCLSLDFKLCLPTEAEWEYACRAGGTGAFHFGESVNTDQVNYNGKFDWNDAEPVGINRQCTMPVDALARNDWGLYQMHGNVWEWCADSLRGYGEQAVDDPGLAAEVGGAARALRGGSWYDYARNARSACRDDNLPGGQDGGVGLRVACRSSS